MKRWIIINFIGILIATIAYLSKEFVYLYIAYIILFGIAIYSLILGVYFILKGNKRLAYKIIFISVLLGIIESFIFIHKLVTINASVGDW